MLSPIAMLSFIAFGSVSIAALGGCAGSASHKVVTAHQAGDEMLSCAEIDAEIIKVQLIVDAVNQDKEDLTGPDVIDGILWFPFNLIAKSQNYSSALEAADKRIERLQVSRRERDCTIMSAEEAEARKLELSKELRELNKLYQDGILTEEEYISAKKRALEGRSE